jgi:hypothetical protein
MIHESTSAYVAIAEQDADGHALAIAALRAALPSLTAVTQQAAAKAQALFDAQCDEQETDVMALFGEAQDKARTTQRLVAEWQERTVLLMRQLLEVEEFNRRFAKAATPAPSVPIA